MPPNTNSFLIFEHAARYFHAKFPYLVGVWDLVDKRNHVLLYLNDLPLRVQEYNQRQKTPHPKHGNMRSEDALPGRRLASACEGLSNAVYAMHEIVARFANRASAAARAYPEIPRSFNDVCKRFRDGTLDASLIAGLNSLDSYERVRELRTEWTHYSTIFIAEDAGGPLLVARSERRSGDRIHFPEDKTLFHVVDLQTWANRAVEVADDFCLECYKRYVLPSIDLDHEVAEPVRDEYGFPVLDAKGGLLTTRITVRAQFTKLGIV